MKNLVTAESLVETLLSGDSGQPVERSKFRRQAISIIGSAALSNGFRPSSGYSWAKGKSNVYYQPGQFGGYAFVRCDVAGLAGPPPQIEGGDRFTYDEASLTRLRQNIDAFFKAVSS